MLPAAGCLFPFPFPCDKNGFPYICANAFQTAAASRIDNSANSKPAITKDFLFFSRPKIRQGIARKNMRNKMINDSDICPSPFFVRVILLYIRNAASRCYRRENGCSFQNPRCISQRIRSEMRRSLYVLVANVGCPDSTKCINNFLSSSLI